MNSERSNMENPTILHELAFLYIGFAQLSNNEIPIEQELAIKRKIAEWLDLSYKNVDQYEMLMRESLSWINSIDEKKKEEVLMSVAAKIIMNENMDSVMVKKVLSEIRDIAVSNGKFDQREKILHDKIAARMGENIITADADCKIITPNGEEEEQIDGTSQNKSAKSHGIGFKYGTTKETKNKGKSKK